MSFTTTQRRMTLPIIVALLTMFGAACGSATAEGGNDENNGDQNSNPELLDVWTRPTAPGATSTAFYATIRARAGVDDQLIGAASNICNKAELHVTDMTDGVMSMSPAETNELTVTPQQELVLEPGGLHIMCMGLTEPIEDGDRVELSVEFEIGGTVTAEAIVESR